MSDVIQLTHSELLVERPFTDPDHIEADAAVMRTMAQQAWIIADQMRMVSAAGTAPTVHYPTAESWQKRTMLLDMPGMHTESTLTVVGFFGNKRTQVDPDVEKTVYEAGRQLCQALRHEPSMVCYMTRLLADAHNYANLVVMKTAQTIEEWRKNEIHQHVTGIISPQYYSNVRIYSGEMHVEHDAPLNVERQFFLSLHRVKYFDYSCPSTWCGVRNLASAPPQPPSVGIRGAGQRYM